MRARADFVGGRLILIYSIKLSGSERAEADFVGGISYSIYDIII